MALREIHRSGAEAPVSPAPGAAEHGKVRLRYRGYVYATTRLSALVDRAKAYREAANDPEVDERRRNRKALLLLGAAGGVLALGSAATIAHHNGVHVPGVSDVFGGGQLGNDIADCVNKNTSSIEQNGVPTPRPGVAVDVWNACVDQAQKASQTSK